ncbi:MAG: hypothetical protein LBL09_01210 [Oscillospiraceae bacterium]|jgi:cation transport ATPase|nr:hypothetical protein [Oscillospiraceae bacterium]
MAKRKDEKFNNTQELVKSGDASYNELLVSYSEEDKYDFSLDDILAEYGNSPEQKEEKNGGLKTLNTGTVQIDTIITEERFEYDEAAEPSAGSQNDLEAEAPGAGTPAGDEFEDDEKKIADLIAATFSAVEAGEDGERVQKKGKRGESIGGKAHIFEDEEEEAPEQKRGLFKRKKKDAEQPKKRKVIKESKDANKLFAENFSQYFGSDAGLAGQNEGSKEEEKEIEASLFYEEETEEREAEEEAGYEESIDIVGAANGIISLIGRMKLRLFVCVVCDILLCYITFAPKLGLPVLNAFTYISSPFIFLFACAALQVIVMVMCIETVTVGIRDLILLRPNMESSVAFAAAASLLHIVMIIVRPDWEGYYPYAAAVSVSLTFAAYYRNKFKHAKLRSYKTVSAMSKPYVVSLEGDVYENYDAYLKQRVNEVKYFVNQTEKRDMARRVWAVLSPITIVASIAFSTIASIGNGQAHRFFFCLAAISAAAAPLSVAMPFYLTFNKAAKRLGVMGEAIAGWKAAEQLSLANDLILTDNDIFPPGSISLNGLKIFGGYAVERVISYSASLIAMSGAGLAKPFVDLLSDQAGALTEVQDFKFYENGGVGGIVAGNHVLAGSGSFMMRTGIKIPRDVNIKSTVFVAINQELAGVFAVNYTVNNPVKNALTVLARNNITPVFAVRDFNITPSMIEAKFKISTDTADFPPIADRLALSGGDRETPSKPLAVIGREGLGHYVESLICARSLKKATKTCLIISAASVVIGMLIMFLLMYIHAPAAASPFNLMLFLILWQIPARIAASWVNS